MDEDKQSRDIAKRFAKKEKIMIVLFFFLLTFENRYSRKAIFVQDC